MQWRIIILLCLIWGIQHIFSNCLMYASLRCYSLHTKKQLPNISRRLALEFPGPCFGGFLLRHDEKHILYKTSKHHGGRRGLYRIILTTFSTSYQLISQPRLRRTPELPPINPKALATLKAPRNRHELRQHTLDATTLVLQSGISSPLKKGLKNFISRLAHQTDIAWTRSELDKIELSDIRTKYAGKQVPKGRRKKLTTVTVADGDYLLQKEREAEEKERAEEERVKGITARKVARAQSASASGGSRAGAGGGHGSRVGRGRGGGKLGDSAQLPTSVSR